MFHRTHKRIKKNWVYKALETEPAIDGRHYPYLIPEGYSIGCRLGDFWEVDSEGNINPDSILHPVPYEIQDIEAKFKVRKCWGTSEQPNLKRLYVLIQSVQ